MRLLRFSMTVRNMFVLVLAVALLAFAGCAADVQPQEPTQDLGDETIDETPLEDEAPSEQDPTSPEEATTPDVTFSVTGENYAFFVDGEENPDMVVQEGDLVRIEFESTQGLHDWVVDAFAATEQVDSASGVTTVEFVADQAGEFEYYCSVGSHRQQGMLGSFIVE